MCKRALPHHQCCAHHPNIENVNFDWCESNTFWDFYKFFEYKSFCKPLKIENYLSNIEVLLHLISIFNRTMRFYLGSKRERHVVESHPRARTQHAHFHTHVCMYTRRNPDGSRQKGAIRSPNKRLPSSRVPPLKIHRRLQQRLTLAALSSPCRERRVSLSVRRFLLSGDGPRRIYRPYFYFESEVTRRVARPGVMRFYESQSGLRALEIFSPTCFSLSRNGRRSEALRRASRTNNDATSIERVCSPEKGSVSNNRCFTKQI